VELAENKDVNFRLGWHVLKNRDYDSRECTAEERDQAEEKFFSQGIWTSLPPSHMGISSLKSRLSRVLKDQILSELPSLIQDVQAGIDDYNRRLERLGGSRATKKEQRRYLSRVSQDFSRLLTAAVGGSYVDPFFGDSNTKDGYSKRLRAVIQNTLLSFANDMRSKGHVKEIAEGPFEDGGVQEGSMGPPEVLRNQAVKDVEELMKRTRGRELPGIFNP
jgi:Dynamin central region